MSKVKVNVEMCVEVNVEVDSDYCLGGRGRRPAKPDENEPFDKQTIEQWFKDEFTLSISRYETECEHGYVDVFVDCQSVENVDIEEFEQGES